MRCKICGNEQETAICSRCEYDESLNREQYPTLEDDGRNLISNGARRNAFVSSLIAGNFEMQSTLMPKSQSTKTESLDTTQDYCQKAPTRGGCGNYLTWEMNKNGLLTISGLGEMNDFKHGETPWVQYCKSITEVKLPVGIVNIGLNAFDNCVALTKITIPHTVKKIGYDAFDNCPRLVIHGDAGSLAEAYAKENGIPFERQ